jgi:TIR domain
MVQDIFVSYAMEDKPTADAAVARLESRGLRCWIAPRDITPGDDWYAAIPPAIQAAHIFVLVFSSHANASPQVKREVERAASRGLSIVPVRIENVMPSGNLEFFLSSPHWLEAVTPPLDERLDYLADTVSLLLSRAAARESADPPQPLSTPAAGLVPDPPGGGISPAPYQPKHYLPQMRRGAWAELRHHREQLREVVAKLAFTPILGPECSTLGRLRDPGRVRIGAAMNAVLFDEQLMESEEEAYVRALAEVEEVPLEALPTAGATPHEDIHELRLRLVRFAYKAGSVFGHIMADTAIAARDIREQKVESHHGSEWEELREFAIRACEVARRLRREAQDESSNVPPDYDARGVYNRLIEAGRRIVGGSISPARRRRLEMHHDEDMAGVFEDLGLAQEGDPLRQQVAAGALYMHDLEWLADLVWYAFRFDVHSGLTNRELAFQFSLGVSDASHIRDMTTIAELIGERANEMLPRWLEAPTDGKASDSTRFFDAIALLLQRQDRDSQQGGTRLPGVALSTTFDAELQAAFARSGAKRFSVVMPLRCSPGDQRDSPYIRWAGVCHDVEAGTVSWTWIDEASPMIPPRGLAGPVVVKLNGAPLYSLPSPEELPREPNLDLSHLITISESGYLYHIVLLSALPRFVARVLTTPERSLFFLGHPVEDWNVRLRIHEHIFPDRSLRSDRMTSVNPTRLTVAVNKYIDPFRSSALDNLGIDRWQGDLSDIAALIADVLQ